MSPVAVVWLEFAACMALIGVAGTYLSRYGDAIAEKTGLGGSWIGLVLLATVTSLPELINGISSVTLADTPDIAVGDVLGSCVFNLALLVLLDLLWRRETCFRQANHGHVLAATLGVALIGLVALAALLPREAALPSIAHVGWYTPLILLVYVGAMRALYRQETRSALVRADAQVRYATMTLHQASTRYVIAAAVVVAAGTALPFVGAELARINGWHQSFVGTVFVAATTSVPELVVTLAALRLGALDMAIGNLLGSNLFDVAILAVDDLLFLRGPILEHVAPVHAVSALSAILMSALVALGVLLRPRRRLFGTVTWVSAALLAVYLLNVVAVYSGSGEPFAPGPGSAPDSAPRR